MKKYLLKLQGFNGDIEFSLPVFKGSRKSVVLSKILLSLASISLFLALVSIFLSVIVTNSTFESSTFNAALLFIGLLSGFSGAFLLLQGKKSLVDPMYFLSVLFFALLTTTASVLKSPAHITNTFGIDLVRSFSGLAIMIFVGLFYFVNLSIRDNIMLKRVFRILNYSLVTLLVLTLIQVNVFDQSFVINNLQVFIPIYFFLFVNIAFSDKRKLLKFSLLALSAIFTFLTPQAIPDSVLSTKLILTAIVSILIILGIYILNNKDRSIKWVENLKNLPSTLKEQKYSITDLTYILILVVAVVSVLIGVFIHFRFNITADVITSPLDEFFKSLRVPFSNGIDLSALLIGNGSYNFAKKISNLDSTMSTITNIFTVQGFLGLLAYIYINIVGFVAMIKSLRLAFENKAMRALILTLSFIMSFVTVFSLISYTGFFLIILWWLTFALFSVYLGLNGSQKEFIYTKWNVDRLVLKGKMGVYFRVLASILILLITAFALFSFTKIGS